MATLWRSYRRRDRLETASRSPRVRTGCIRVHRSAAGRKVPRIAACDRSCASCFAAIKPMSSSAAVTEREGTRKPYVHAKLIQVPAGNAFFPHLVDRYRSHCGAARRTRSRKSSKNLALGGLWFARRNRRRFDGLDDGEVRGPAIRARTPVLVTLAHLKSCQLREVLRWVEQPHQPNAGSCRASLAASGHGDAFRAADADPLRHPFGQRRQIVASEVDDRSLHAIGSTQGQDRSCPAATAPCAGGLTTRLRPDRAFRRSALERRTRRQPRSSDVSSRRRTATKARLARARS